MGLAKTRSVLYKLARLLGDVNAIEKGRVPRRILRRVAGKLTGRFLGRIFRVAVLASVLGAIPALAGEEPALVPIVPDGGTVVEQGGRIDLYDARSNRVGYGSMRGDGSWDIFNVDGSRRATVTPGIGGAVRVTVPKTRK